MAIFAALCFVLLSVFRLSLGEENEHISLRLYDILDKMVRLENKIEQWEKERVSFQETVLSILEHRKDEMQGILNDQRESVKIIRNDYEVFRDQINNRTEHFSEICAPPQEKPAFTACLDNTESFSAGDILIFNKVLYNQNDGYNQKTGIFTVQTNGTYIFSFHIEDYLEQNFPVHLTVDSVRKGSAVIFPHNRSTQSGNTVVLGLRAGQLVWIEVERSGRVYGAQSFCGTTFSGAYI